MAVTSTIDQALDNLASRLLPVFRPLLTLMKSKRVVVGLLIGAPLVLFVLLVSIRVFHWWAFPWSEREMLWLLWWMTLGAIVNTLIYGLAFLLFFLTWWWNRLRVSEQKRPRLALTYTFMPLFYGFIVTWGVTSLKGMRGDMFAYVAMAMFVMMVFGNTVLRVSEGNKPSHGAV